MSARSGRRRVAGAVVLALVVIALGGLLTLVTGAVGFLRYRQVAAVEMQRLGFDEPTPQRYGVFPDQTGVWRWLYRPEFDRVILVGLDMFVEHEESDAPLPRWVEHDALPALKSPEYRTVIAVGLPMRSFVGIEEFSTEFAGVIVRRGRDPANNTWPWWPRRHVRSLAADIAPTHVRWPEFLVNVAFWSVVVFGVVRLPRVWRWVRGGWRRRRGRCAGCGYEVGEAPGVCPECGATCDGSEGPGAEAPA